jgi:hypothetical protein
VLEHETKKPTTIITRTASGKIQFVIYTLHVMQTRFSGMCDVLHAIFLEASPVQI